MVHRLVLRLCLWLRTPFTTGGACGLPNGQTAVHLEPLSSIPSLVSCTVTSRLIAILIQGQTSHSLAESWSPGLSQHSIGRSADILAAPLGTFGKGGSLRLHFGSQRLYSPFRDTLRIRTLYSMRIQDPKNFASACEENDDMSKSLVQKHVRKDHCTLPQHIHPHCPPSAGFHLHSPVPPSSPRQPCSPSNSGAPFRSQPT